MYKQKIRAFTIMEVTVTMLVTAILIGITYTSYSIIVKSYGGFNTKNDEMAALVSLDHVLKRDFERSEGVYKTQDGIVLKKENSVIGYVFAPGYVIRNAARADTFKVQVQDMVTSFENAPLNEVQETEELNRTDELAFTLTYKNEQIPYLYHKLYSSVNLIQRNPNAVN
jgi:Tfp pilus assembly protein PilE